MATVVFNLSVNFLSVNGELNKLRQRMGKTRVTWLEDNTNQIHFQKSIFFFIVSTFLEYCMKNLTVM